MGKTASGAVWLDAEADLALRLLPILDQYRRSRRPGFWPCISFLPMAEIEVVEHLDGADLNAAKAVLAFEATAMVHGPEEAVKAYQAAATCSATGSIPQHLPSIVRSPDREA
jgi:tyrosyl-tRNA synthetase